MEGLEAFSGNQYTLLCVVFLGALILTSVGAAINAFLIGYLWLRYYSGWSTYNQYAVTTGVFMLGAWFVLAIGGSILLVRERRAKQMGQFPQLLTVILLALIGFVTTAAVASLGLADAQRTLTTDLMIVRTYFGTLLGLSGLCMIWLLIGGTIAMKRAKRTFDAVAQPPPVVLDPSVYTEAAKLPPEEAEVYINAMTNQTRMNQARKRAVSKVEQSKNSIAQINELESELRNLNTILNNPDAVKNIKPVRLKQLQALQAELTKQIKKASETKSVLENQIRFFEQQAASISPQPTRLPPPVPSSGTRLPPPVPSSGTRLPPPVPSSPPPVPSSGTPTEASTPSSADITDDDGSDF
jgi:hypothetical protein